MRALTILLVEDNQDHAELIRRALRGNRFLNTVQVARDGEEALQYLMPESADPAPADCPRPDLVLLDIKLPRMDGVEVLRRIKQDEELRGIPVVMLTTSTRDEEVIRCYELGANSYVCKPVRFQDFMETIRSLERYWLVTNRLPGT